jgi:regulator of protease activity HflC (stomatin/prohibitin superfamily)
MDEILATLPKWPLVVTVVVAGYLFSAVHVLREYERGVVFRLGRLLGKPKGPGLIFIFWPIDRMLKVDLRTITMDVPPQDIVTKDNVTARVNAVAYFRVVDASRAITEVENFLYATSQLAQTTLRSVLGEVELDELLSQREKLNLRLQEILDRHTDAWGIKVSLVEMKQVDLPEEMRRALAKQAEAEREKRAKIIHAAGELEASKKLYEASMVLAQEPVSVQLRYLQTLTEIGMEKNTTVVFPIPMDILTYFQKQASKV